MKKVYICTPLQKHKFDLKKISTEILKEKVFAFIPPVGQLENKELGKMVDKIQIEMCDELWAFGLLGRDCAWEIGYAQGLGKPVKIFIDDENKEMLDDWMLFCCNTKIIPQKKIINN